MGVVLDPDEKLEIARALSEAGVERIEAGFPRVSDDDYRAVRLIAGAGLDAEIWGFSRAVRADVEALVELGVQASVIESPISDLKLRALGVSRETMLERIREAVSFAVESGIRVAYFGVDGTRADPDFFDAAYTTAVEAGAARWWSSTRSGSPRRRRSPSWSSARASSWGRRSPCTSTATTTSASPPRTRSPPSGRARAGSTARSTAWASAPATRTSARSRSRCARSTASRPGSTSRACGRWPSASGSCPGYALEPWKPLVGENLFRRESGAVASQFHDPPSIEPYSSELVGAERSIVLGKKSGLDSIRIKGEELGLDVPEERAAPTCSPPSSSSAPRSAASSRTRSSVSSSTKEERVSHHRELVDPPDLHPAPGFSHIAVAHGTKVVHFAGQLGIGQDFSLVAEDLPARPRRAMRNLKTAMDAAGVTWDDIVRRTIYTTQPTEYELITEAIDEVTGGADHPPRRSSASPGSPYPAA